MHSEVVALPPVQDDVRDVLAAMDPRVVRDDRAALERSIARDAAAMDQPAVPNQDVALAGEEGPGLLLAACDLLANQTPDERLRESFVQSCVRSAGST